MKVKEIALDSWDEFPPAASKLAEERTAAAKKGTYHSELLFRGQADSSWPLATTLERWTGKTLRASRYHLGLGAVKDEAESRIDKSWDIPDYPDFLQMLEKGSEGETKFYRLLAESQLYEFMVYLRHHGFPSPLLDWTMSPFIAAYFAFANAKPYVDISIYAYQEYAGHGKGGYAAAPRIEQLGRHVRTHVRHFQQQALYTIAIKDTGLGMTFCTYEEALSKSSGEAQDLLWKYTIPGGERRRALSYLQHHNLTAYSLFGSEESLMESLAIREFTLGS